MIGLLQRVRAAWVEIDNRRIAAIGTGMVVMVAVEPGDGRGQVERLLERLLSYRVFPDPGGRMNRSLADVDGGLLLVPQFTLAADTSKGRRPSFTSAAPPALGRALFDALVELARNRHPHVGAGRFGADMQVGLVNDGPVTFWLHVR